MSEAVSSSAFVDAEADEQGLRVAEALIAEGRAAELAGAALAELASEQGWRRERALHRLCGVRGGEALLPPLEQGLRSGDDPERRNAARSALAALASPAARAEAAALGALDRLATADADPDVRLLAASALGESGNPLARAPLERALRDEWNNVVAAAADALGVLGDARAVPALAERVRNGDVWSRLAATVALGRIGDPAAIPALQEAALDLATAEAASAALGEIARPEGLGVLRVPARSEDAFVRAAAQRAAAEILAANPGLIPPEWLRESLGEREGELVRDLGRGAGDATARLLGIVGTPGAAGALLERMADPEQRPSIAAGLALLPAEVALPAILARLPEAGAPERAALLGVLPRPVDSADVERVARLLRSPDPEVRGAAAEALARADEAVALPRLLDALADPAARAGATLALGRLGGDHCARLTELLDDADARVREAAADGIARCSAGAVGARIADALRREVDPRVRRALVRALGATGGPEAVRELLRVGTSGDPVLRFGIVRALGRTGTPEALPPLLDALADPAPEIQAAALRALGELGDPRATPSLEAGLDADDRDLRRTAFAALGRVASAAVTDRLVRALDDPDREIRLAAVRTLARVAPRDFAEPLARVRDRDPDPLVRNAAARALGEATDDSLNPGER